MKRTTYTTLNSTYIVEEYTDGLEGPDVIRVKREGAASPFPHRLAETGVFYDAVSVTPYMNGLYITFPEGPATITSTVTRSEVEVVR